MSMTLLVSSVLILTILSFGLISHFVFRNKFPMVRNRRFMSVDESRFFVALEKALSDKYYIYSKVRLLDITSFQKTAGALNKRSVNKRLKNLCADFVVCKKDDMSIIGVVELEKFNKRISAKQKKHRESLMSSVCREADIRLFYFDGRQDYAGMDLCRLITGRSKSKPIESKRRKSVVAEPSMMSIEEGDSMMETDVLDKVRSCPKCYSEVVIKVAVKGDNIGEKFLMCRKYPYCDYQLSVKDESLKTMQSKEDQRRGKAGYRNFS